MSICSLFFACLLASCSATPAATPPALPSLTPLPQEIEPPLPAEPSTLPPTETPVGTATSLPSSTPTPCIASLTYIEDVTFEDNTIVPPGSLMDKQWLVQNSGTCDWNETFALRLITGESMGVEEQVLYPARSGTQAILQMTLTSPTEPGWYTSTWQATADDGSLFGDVLTIAIVVQSP